MGKIIAFANQKGGVGKTTSTVNIAASLGILGRRVLVVDLDPQGNTTSGVGISKKTLRRTMHDVLSDGMDVAEVILKTEFENLWILPSNISLAGSEFDLYEAEESEFQIKKVLEPLKNDFDYIIIDCPPLARHADSQRYDRRRRRRHPHAVRILRAGGAFTADDHSQPHQAAL